MRRGPKGQVDPSRLPFRGRGTESQRFAQFCKKYLRVSVDRKSVPMVLRSWQRELFASILDAEPRPAIATWVLPRGSSKSTMIAAYALYTLFTSGPDTMIDVVAKDERQAGILFGIAAKWVQRSSELDARALVYRDRITLADGSEFSCLPATAAALEGRMPTVAICDEGGRIDREVYEVTLMGAQKVPGSLTVVIGTPGPDPDNVLAANRAYCLANPGDMSHVYREFSAAGFEDHPVDCEHCWKLASPALGDWLSVDGMRAVLPPATTEAHFRRVRLCQWVTGQTEPVLPAGVWDGLATGERIPDGTDVVLGFDGSYSGTDCTVIVAATVSKQPHLQLVGQWQRPRDADRDYRIPILEVEDKLRELCRRFNVREVTADPYRWQRSLEVLKYDGVNVSEFPQTVTRMSAATADFLTACNSGQLSHAGDVLMRQHIGNAVLSEDGRGARMVKASRSRHAGEIDSAVAAVMAHSRASWLAGIKPKSKRTVSFK